MTSERSTHGWSCRHQGGKYWGLPARVAANHVSTFSMLFENRSENCMRAPEYPHHLYGTGQARFSYFRQYTTYPRVKGYQAKTEVSMCVIRACGRS